MIWERLKLQWNKLNDSETTHFTPKKVILGSLGFIPVALFSHWIGLKLSNRDNFNENIIYFQSEDQIYHTLDQGRPILTYLHLPGEPVSEFGVAEFHKAAKKHKKHVDFFFINCAKHVAFCRQRQPKYLPWIEIYIPSSKTETFEDRLRLRLIQNKAGISSCVYKGGWYADQYDPILQDLNLVPQPNILDSLKKQLLLQLNSKIIEISQLKMETVGEVMYCCEETNGQLVTLEYFNGRAVNMLGGGYNKIYIVESSGQVCALHPPEADGFSEDEDIGEKFEIEVQHLENIGPLKNIVCGRYHTLYLNIDGFLFSAGKGIYGVLGLGGAAQSQTPVLIKALSDKKISQIACGESHSLAVTKDGDLYAWGRGFEGQLGLSQSIECVQIPKFLKFFFQKPITNVACGQRHSIAIDQEGSVYTWGEGRCGQLGCGRQRKQMIPQLVQIFNEENSPVRGLQAAAGISHTAIITDEGDLYAWGLNNYGQLGTGDRETRWTPVEIQKDIVGIYLLPVKQVACGSYSTYIIDKNGKAYSWGKGHIGHKQGKLEENPRVITLNTENRIFSQVFACYDSVAFFAPLRIFSISPFCGPASGETKLTLIGTAFADTEKLRIRFRYGNYAIEEECDYDVHSNSIQVLTPNFLEDVDDLVLPVTCYIDITENGSHYNTCDQQFQIYSDKLTPSQIHPKCASVKGGTDLQIMLNLDEFSEELLWHLTVGFVTKPKGFSLNKSANTGISTPMHRPVSRDESIISTNSRIQAEQGVLDIDWRLTPGKYHKGIVSCVVPSLLEYDENSMAYMVDVAINGQQFTKNALNFRYYDIEVQEVMPQSGSPQESTTIRISGKGFYDSSAKKILMTGINGEREVPLQWDRKLKQYLCAIPPVSWLFGGEEPTHEQIKETIENPIQLKLTLNGAEYIQLPEFRYADPHVLRLSKVKVPDGLTEEEKIAWWEGYEQEAEEEDEQKAKREAEEDLAMSVPIKPGAKLYIHTNRIFQSEFLSARFTLEGNFADVPVVFKNEFKVGVEVPDLGDIPTAQEVTVEFSLNAQSFSSDGKIIRYFGISAHDEPIRGRRK